MTSGDGVASGMTEAGIRAAIAQLELLLPDRSCSTRELWERYSASLPVDQAWVRSVRSMMVRVLDALGDVQVIALRPSHWTDYRNGPGRSLSPTTRNLQLRRTKAMLHWAIDDGRIYDSPFRRVKQEKARGKRETEISEEDEARVTDAVPLAVSVLFQVTTGSGMRIGEVRMLRWDQIDLELRIASLAWDESKGRVAATINLTQAAVDALKLMPRGPSPYVFASPRTNKPLTYAYFWQHLRGAFDDLGLKAAPGDGRVHPHDTRHSVASRLNRRGAKLTDIQGVLRHANLAQTALYIHTRADEIAAAAALLERPRKGPHRAERAPKVDRDKASASG
jgi:integrase